MPSRLEDSVARVEQESPWAWPFADRLGGLAAVGDVLAPTAQCSPRLEYLERRKFDSSKAHVGLELCESNVFIMPLKDFDVPHDTRKHPLPREFEMFVERRRRLDAMYYQGKESTTRRLDQQERDRGVDVDGRMVALIESFLTENPRGRQILYDMGGELHEITIDQMTPKESIYLIGYLMHELTKYDTSKAAGGDTYSSYDIIANGVAASAQETVPPLGVCRNFADTAEALFLALKSRNPRLTNTYCNNMGGWNGAIDGQFYREGDRARGHAWLDFVQVDASGNMAITTVDPTWVKRNGRKLEAYDLTAARMSMNLRNLAAGEQENYSKHKQRNMARITGFYTARTGKMTTMLKKRYPTRDGKLHLAEIPEDDHLFIAAMHTSLDYVIAGSEFGGSAFSWDFEDLASTRMFHLAYHAAQRTDFVLSNSEYKAAKMVFETAWHKYPGSRDKIEQLRKQLQRRHEIHMATSGNSDLFRLNEGDFAKSVG